MSHVAFIITRELVERQYSAQYPSDQHLRGGRGPPTPQGTKQRGAGRGERPGRERGSGLTRRAVQTLVAPRLHRARRGGPCPARSETKSPAPDDPTFLGLEGGGLRETEGGAEVGVSPEYGASLRAGVAPW
ncbi:Cyclic Nucleotide-Gated Olfactory Channel [Manis pentadactyla]|nr:Cyclic Nucleotide-Gated Olfactory Channel [Manis pentadactyla]